MLNPLVRGFVFLLCWPVFVIADQIDLVNGDHISGHLVSLEKDKLKFQSSLLGNLVIPVSKVKHLQTDEQVVLQLKSGEQILRQLSAGAPGVLYTKELVDGSVHNVMFSDLESISYDTEPSVQWSGKIASSLSVEQGNSESQDLNIDVHLIREKANDRLILDVEFVENREQNVDTGKDNTSKRRYYAGVQYDYFISKQTYLYGDVSAEKEATANIDLRSTAGVGAGYRVLQTQRSRIEIEGGLSGVNESFSDNTDNNSYIGLRTGWKLDHQLYENVKLFHYGRWISSLQDTEDQLIKTETGLRTRVNSHLLLEIKVLADWDQSPAISKEKEDFSYLFGLGWEF